ncbi:MAG: AAA family ATPase, partial [Parahaliea sp.]
MKCSGEPAGASLAAVTSDAPFYQSIGDECELFQHAYQQRLPLLLKGPTGCGKTRFVQHMAARLNKKLYTVACHDD